MNISRILRKSFSKLYTSRRLQSQSSQIVDVNSSSPKTKSLEVDKPRKLLNGPNLRDFFKNEHLKDQENIPEEEVIPYLQNTIKYGEHRKVFFDIYGCQMNVSDTEIIWSILKANNFLKTNEMKEADVILLITCAIREGAENKVWGHLDYISHVKKKQAKVGILGCMAERLKHKILEKNVDLVAGPDSYKDLPRLLALTENNQTAINVLLSFDETYADVMPVRLDENAVTAFVSIMRGCDNMCTYCIVPFTRGRERSRPITSILNEVKQLSEQGIKQVTLLGQNVNSYRDLSQGTNFYTTNLAKGFKTVYKNKVGGLRFSDLLHQVADIDPEMRIRFTSPHPKDFPDEVLKLIRDTPNICRNLHLPAQSGNSAVLERMRRGYTREAYLELVQHVKQILPDVSLSSDFICGFCGETDEEFMDTITLLESVRYNCAYLFQYSLREKTTAHRRFQDDVSKTTKQKRLEEMVKTYRPIVEALNCAQIGQLQLVLVEGKSKRSDLYLQGRNDANIKVIFPAGELPTSDDQLLEVKPGDYVVVQINMANSQVLKGIPLYHTTLNEFLCKHVESNVDNYLKYSSFM